MIIKFNRTLYGKTYYRPVKELDFSDPELISLIEGKDLNYGDYYTAAILNYFRQKMLAGEKQVTVSHNELKEHLRIDKSRLSVRVRIKDLLKTKLIKGRLNGRIYDYELTNAIINNRSPEVIDELSDKLCEYFNRHLRQLGIDVPGRSKLSFQRMLVDGYEYDTIKHIIAYLGYKKPDIRGKITQVAHLRKHYERLYEEAFLSISKRKAHTYLYKLCAGITSIPQTIIQHLPTPSPVATIIEEPHELAIIRPARSDAQLWDETLKWFEGKKRLIEKFYYQHSRVGLGTILEKEDIFNSMMYKIFESLKKNPSGEVSLSSNYLEKWVKCLLMNSASQSYLDIDENRLLDSNENILNEDTVTVKETANAVTPLLDEESRSEGIKNQLKVTGLSEEVLNIITDSLALNGVRYTQRDLAAKYGKSLSKTNRILKKYIPIIHKKIESLAPPPP